MRLIVSRGSAVGAVHREGKMILLPTPKNSTVINKAFVSFAIVTQPLSSFFILKRKSGNKKIVPGHLQLLLFFRVMEHRVPWAQGAVLCSLVRMGLSPAGRRCLLVYGLPGRQGVLLSVY